MEDYKEQNTSIQRSFIHPEKISEVLHCCICDEVFNNRGYPLCWKSDKSWEGVLEEMRGLVWRYLREGKYASLLRSKQAVAIGFVDGDLELL